MKRVRNALILALSLVSFWLYSIAAFAQFSQTSPTNATTVILGGTLIDGNGGEPLRDAVIVIEGNRIKNVGQKGQISYPQTAHTIDANGKFILPGLIDSHIHYRDWLAELLLAHGVTSMVHMGDPTDWVFAQRNGIDKGKIPGPRIFASGDQMGNRVPAGNPEDAGKSVRYLISRGANKISTTMLLTPESLKVVIDEAHKAGIPVSAWTMYPREAIAMGLDAVEHCYTLGIASKRDPKVLEAIREEQRRNVPRYEKKTLNYLMDDDAEDFIQLLVEKGAYVIPDLIFDFKNINDRYKDFERENLELLLNPKLRYLSVEDWVPLLTNNTEGGIPKDPAGLFGTIDRESEEFRQYQKGYRTVQSFLRKLVAAGGKVLAGSDAPNILMGGLSMHHELQLLVDAGLTPMQAIMAGTKWPASFLRQQNHIGTIAPGKLADLIIVRANPLQDIANTKTIDLVMKDGVALDTSFHPDFSTPIPRPENFESQGNPVPVLADMFPKMATEEDSEVTITLEGDNFIKASVVSFDGITVPTTFVKSTQIKATVPGVLLSRVGTFPITVWSPRPLGGTSNKLLFIVQFR